MLLWGKISLKTAKGKSFVPFNSILISEQHLEIVLLCFSPFFLCLLKHVSMHTVTYWQKSTIGCPIVLTVFCLVDFLFAQRENCLTLDRFLQRYVFGPTVPKQWHQYIKQFLSLSHQQSDNNYKKDTYLNCLYFIGVMRKFPIWDRYFPMCQTESMFPLETETTVFKTPMGKVREFPSCRPVLIHERMQRDVSIGQREKRFKEHILFLDNLLNINLTIHYIFISTSWHWCRLASFLVQTKVSDKHSMSFEYCRTHSNFILYPPGRQISIQLFWAFAEIRYDYKFEFCVFDSDILNISTTHHLQEHRPVFVLVPKTFNYFLSRYNVKVSKLYSMKIIINDQAVANTSITLFDGPGTLSDLLYCCSFQFTNFATSSFKFTALVLSSIQVLESQTFLNFTSYLKKISCQIFMKAKQTRTIHFPNTDTRWILPMKDNLIIINVSTSSSLFLNMSVTSFSYEGQNQTDCNYAGVAGYDVNSHPSVNRIFQEISTLCDGNSFVRPLYTSSPELILVIYFYMEYGYSQSSIALSTTKCRKEVVNICKFKSTTFLMEGLATINLSETNQCKIVQLKNYLEASKFEEFSDTFQPKQKYLRYRHLGRIWKEDMELFQSYAQHSYIGNISALCLN